MSSWRRHLPVLLLFAALTAILAFPVVEIMLRGGVPGWEGDNLYYVHSMWWWKHALLKLHASPFYDMESFYPFGRANGRSELTVTNTLLGLPLTVAFGPVVAYDLVVLLSFVLTGFFTYLWVYELTGRRDAGILGGTIAAFMPLRFAHLPGHLPQMTTQWVPLALYALERFVARPSVRRGLGLGAAVAAVILGCWYYGYALAVILPCYLLLRTWRQPVWRDRAWWTGLAAGGVLAGVLLAPFVYQMFLLRGSGALSRGLGEMDSWSLNPYDLFLPNALHPFLTDFMTRTFPRQRALWVEQGVTLGLVAAAFGFVGWLASRRRTVAARALAGTWLISYLIALGPTLHWKDQQVRVPAPAPIVRLAERSLSGTSDVSRAVGASFHTAGVPIPLPALAMFKFVPLTSSMRVMARFALWTAFMTAAFAGFGLITVTAWAERRWGPAARGAVPVLAVALVCFECLSQIAVEPLGPRAVDTWLATQPASTVIVELPVDQALRSLQNYWMTINARKNLFGWIGDSFPPPVQVERAAALASFPSPAALDYLRHSPATLLLITPSQVPDWSTIEPVLRASPALAGEQAIGDVRVFRIVH